MTVSPPPLPGLRQTAKRELERARLRPSYLLMTLILPIAGWFILLNVFNYRVPRDLPVAVIDLDRSALSRRVVRAIDATPAAQVVLRAPDATGAEGILRRGEAYAVVVLAEGLERQVLRGEAMPVSVFYNAQWMLPGSLITRDLRAAVGAISSDLDAGGQMARGASRDKAKALADPIRTELHPLFNPALDYAAFLLLALIPTLFQVFVLVMAVQAVGIEFREGTIDHWLASAGGSVPRAVTGKLLPYALWFTVLEIGLTEFTLRWLGLTVEGSRSMLYGGMALFTLAYQGIGLLLIALNANLRLSLSLAGIIAGPAFALAGVSYPLFAMPLAGRIWAALLPLSHYLAVQTQQTTTGARLAVSAPGLLALLAFSVVLPLLCLPRLSRLMRDASCWMRS